MRQRAVGYNVKGEENYTIVGEVRDPWNGFSFSVISFELQLKNTRGYFLWKAYSYGHLQEKNN